MPSRGSFGCHMTVVQTLQPFLTMLYMSSLIVTFSAVTVVVFHFISALLLMPSNPVALLLSEKSLGIIAVCMACVPSASGRHKWVVIILLLVLLPYALKGLLAFLVSNHMEISFRILQGTYDTMYPDSTSNLNCGFMVISIGQGQGFAIGKSFTLRVASSKDEAFH